MSSDNMNRPAMCLCDGAVESERTDAHMVYEASVQLTSPRTIIEVLYISFGSEAEALLGTAVHFLSVDSIL